MAPKPTSRSSVPTYVQFTIHSPLNSPTQHFLRPHEPISLIKTEHCSLYNLPPHIMIPLIFNKLTSDFEHISESDTPTSLGLTDSQSIILQPHAIIFTVTGPDTHHLADHVHLRHLPFSILKTTVCTALRIPLDNVAFSLEDAELKDDDTPDSLALTGSPTIIISYKQIEVNLTGPAPSQYSTYFFSYSTTIYEMKSAYCTTHPDLQLTTLIFTIGSDILPDTETPITLGFTESTFINVSLNYITLNIINLQNKRLIVKHGKREHFLTLKKQFQEYHLEHKVPSNHFSLKYGSTQLDNCDTPESLSLPDGAIIKMVSTMKMIKLKVTGPGSETFKLVQVPVTEPFIVLKETYCTEFKLEIEDYWFFYADRKLAHHETIESLKIPENSTITVSPNWKLFQLVGPTTEQLEVKLHFSDPFSVLKDAYYDKFFVPRRMVSLVNGTQELDEYDTPETTPHRLIGTKIKMVFNIEEVKAWRRKMQELEKIPDVLPEIREDLVEEEEKEEEEMEVVE